MGDRVLNGGEGLQSLRDVAVTLDWEDPPAANQSAAEYSSNSKGNDGGAPCSSSGNLPDALLDGKGIEVDAQGKGKGDGKRAARLVVRAACPLRKGTLLSHGLHVIGAPADVVLFSEGPEALAREPSGQTGEEPGAKVEGV